MGDVGLVGVDMFLVVLKRMIGSTSCDEVRERVQTFQRTSSSYDRKKMLICDVLLFFPVPRDLSCQTSDTK
jgi:hypothetical protein